MSDDKKQARLDEAAEELKHDVESDMKSSTVADDVGHAHTVEKNQDAAEDADLHDEQKTPPEKRDEQSASGNNPALTSDDDIDEVGKEHGVHYSDEEELDVSKKVKIQTESEPPEKIEE